MASPAPNADASGSRYELLTKIASGGMATVYVGRQRGAVGFWRFVAIKRAHAHLVENPTYRQMLVDEARLASRLHHPNVVAVLDVEELAGELRLVMDYVEGAALSDLIAKSHAAEQRFPARIAVRIGLDACAGLHAAHDLRDDDGKPLGLVHRDVSPHNILVGVDGVARLSDFGIAKQAEGGVSTTTGALKGKLGYMAPEYVEEGKLDARSDVFALGVVVWEALANQKLFRGTNEVDTLKRVVAAKVPPLSSVAPWAGEQLDPVIAAALARLPEERFATAQAFGAALEAAARRDDLIATPAEVGAYVRDLVGGSLDKRKAQIRERTAPIRHEPTVRATRPPGAPLEATPTVPAEPTPEPTVAEGPATGSNITLRHTASMDTSQVPVHRAPWRAALAIGLGAAVLGGAGVFALRGKPAPVLGAASAVAREEAHPPPIATAASASTTSSALVPSGAPSAAAPVAGARSAAPPASARAPGKGRPSTTAAPDPGETIAPNPYGAPKP